MDLPELILFMERRLGWARDESDMIQRSLSGHASTLASQAQQLARIEGQVSELSMLLRVAHGMNPNGVWPHPAGTCVHCGRAVGENERTCGPCQRKGLT